MRYHQVQGICWRGACGAQRQFDLDQLRYATNGMGSEGGGLWETRPVGVNAEEKQSLKAKGIVSGWVNLRFCILNAGGGGVSGS